MLTVFSVICHFHFLRSSVFIETGTVVVESSIGFDFASAFGYTFGYILRWRQTYFLLKVRV